MHSAAADQAIQFFLSEIHSRLGEAARIAKAAEACAATGSIGEAVTVSMDIEQLIYEADRLHTAVTVLRRLTRAS